MTKFKQDNKLKSTDEFFSEANRQLSKFTLNIQDQTKINNLLEEESANLIKIIIDIASISAFEIGYAGCADHIRENSSKNHIKTNVLAKLPNMNDTLDDINNNIDYVLKRNFKKLINEKILGEETSVSDKHYLKFFLLKANESSLNKALANLTDFNNKCFPNSAPK